MHFTPKKKAIAVKCWLEVQAGPPWPVVLGRAGNSLAEGGSVWSVMVAQLGPSPGWWGQGGNEGRGALAGQATAWGRRLQEWEWIWDWSVGSWKVHVTEELSAVSRNSPAQGGAIYPVIGRPQAPKHQKEKVGLIQGYWKISAHLK